MLYQLSYAPGPDRAAAAGIHCPRVGSLLKPRHPKRESCSLFAVQSGFSRPGERERTFKSCETGGSGLPVPGKRPESSGVGSKGTVKWRTSGDVYSR